MKRHRHGFLIALLLAVAAAAAIAPWTGRSGLTTGGGAPGGSEPEESDDDDFRAYRGLSFDSTPDQLTQAAIEAANELVAAFPDGPDAWDVRARLHKALGNLSEAASDWHRCLQCDRSFVASYQGLGWVAIENGQYELAVEMFRQVVARDPQNPIAPPMLGDSLLRLGRIDEVCKDLEPIVKRGSAQPSTLVVLGQAYLQLGRLEDARMAFEGGDPNDKRAHYGLAMVYSRLGRPEESERHMEQFRRLSAASRDVHVSRVRASGGPESQRESVVAAFLETGRVWLKHGDAQRAEAHWRTAAVLEPANVACRTELAALYERAGRDRDALRVCLQLRDIDPKNSDYWLNVGVLHARLGRFEAALSELDKAVELAPGNPRCREVREAVRRARRAS